MRQVPVLILLRHGLVDESMHRQVRGVHVGDHRLASDTDYADDIVSSNTEPATRNEM